MHKLTTLCAVAFVAALGAFGATAVQAKVCSVPADYPNIQSAASDPSCQTINVAPGLYIENVNVTHHCEINGAQANNPVSGRSSGGPAESIVYGNSPTPGLAVFTISASDVTINGFNIQNSVDTGAVYGVLVTGSGSDAAILNNILDGIPTPDIGSNGTAQAIYLTGGPDNVNIQDNEIKKVHSAGSAKGVLIGDDGATNPSQNVQIKGNWIHGITSDSGGAYGVSVANVAGVSGLKIIGNTIEQLTGLFAGCWVRAIGLEGDTPGVEVRDNDINHLNSVDRIAVWFQSNPSFGTAQVHGNNFFLTAAASGIAVQASLTGGSVDGTGNWWNNASGPTIVSNPGGTGAIVSEKVTYSPWLIAPAPDGSSYSPATTAAQCKSGGWMTKIRADGSTFKNQGDCIEYVNTGK